MVVTKPAPNGGLNGRDGLAAMPENDAVVLTNWIPDAGGVRCRRGFREWATNFPGGEEVQSILPFFSASATYPTGAFLASPTIMPGKLYAATKTAVYDITSSTDAPVSVLALSGTDQAGRIYTTMLANTAGSYMLCTSEDDGYFYTDGTTVSQPVMGAGAGQVANVDPTKFVHLLVWKRRAWFVERDSTSAWYLATDAITGAATKYDFGPLMKKGGHLSYLANWTIDAGEGIDDFLVAVGSNGDVMVFKGTDPASAATFALVGTWNVGQIPVGRRAYCQYGGDLLIASADGIFPISFVTRGGASSLVASSSEYTSKIRSKIGPALRSTFTSYGWELFLHPAERLMMVNMPALGVYKDMQFVMNTTLNQWCSFQNIPIVCMGTTGGFAFAGTADGRVLLLFSSFFDNVPYGSSVGDSIYGVIQPVFNSFDTPAMTKVFTMLRPHFIGAAEPGLLLSVAVDYIPHSVVHYPAYSLTGLSTWDSAKFDSSTWQSGGYDSFSSWRGVGAVGSSGAAVLETACVGDTVLTAIDYQYIPGGPF